MKKVLLIEDDERIIYSLRLALEGEGYKVLSAENGESGLSMARSDRPDIILLDILLPDINGIEICRSLKSDPEYKSIPVVMLTALGDTENTVKGLSAGANDYVSKPFNLMELLARVKSHLRMKELYDAIKREEQEKTVLLDVSQSLSSSVDPHETLYTIVSKIAEIIEVKRCSVIYINSLAKKAYVMASHDSKEVKRLEIDINKYPEIQKIMETGEKVIVNDVMDDPVLCSVREVLNLVGIKSMMAFPIAFKDSLIGTLILRTSRRESPFNDREIRFCELISHLAGSPLKNAYLFDMLYREREQEREARVAAEEKLRGSEERYKTLVQTLPDIIYNIDEDGKFLFISNSIKNLGYDPEELIGKHFSEVIHPNDIGSVNGSKVLLKYEGKITGDEKAPKIFNEKRTGKRMTRELEVRLMGKIKGKEKKGLTERISSIIVIGDVDASGHYVTSEDTKGKKFIGTAGIIRDITERKHNEEIQRKKTEQVIRFQGTLVELAKLDYSDIGSVLKKITEVDAKTLGVERVSIWFFTEDGSEIICKDLYKLNENLHEKGMRLKHQDYPSYFKALDESRALAANDARSDPRTSAFTEGYLIPFGITSLMDVPARLHGKVAGIVCHEHTGPTREWTMEEQDFAASIADLVSIAFESAECERAEEKAKRQQEQLVQADKMISLGTLVAGVAHEINNPNHSIILNVPSIEEIWRDAKPLIMEGAKIAGEKNLANLPIEEAANLCDKLLAIIKKESKRIDTIVNGLKDFTRIDVSGYVNKVDVGEVIHSSVKLIDSLIKKSTRHFKINLDSLPIIRANFQKLEQVMVTIIINACQALTDFNQVIEVTAFHDQANGLVSIQVKDEGIGMEKETLHRAIEPFFTTKQGSGGTGLGVSISYGIIREHGGTLRYESKPGKGTIVTIALPVNRDEIENKKTGN